MNENEVAIPSDPMKEFREKVAKKLREDIGSMLPDAALTDMVQRAVEEQFFKTRTVKEQWGPDKIIPSWFVEEVAKSAEPIIRELVQLYVKTHQDTIKQAIDEFLDEKYIAFVAFAALRSSTSEDFMMMADQIVTRLRQG